MRAHLMVEQRRLALRLKARGLSKPARTVDQHGCMPISAYLDDIFVAQIS